MCNAPKKAWFIWGNHQYFWVAKAPGSRSGWQKRQLARRAQARSWSMKGVGHLLCATGAARQAQRTGSRSGMELEGKKAEETLN